MIPERLLRTTAAIGEKNTQILLNSKVMIAGLGGVGGYALETLLRTGVQNYILADFDVFETTNLNRQLLSSLAVIGQKKTEVARKHILEINPQSNITIFDGFIDSTNIEFLLNMKPDLVVDAIDSIDSKCFLIQSCLKKGIPVVSSMGAALRKDPTKVQTGDISKTYGCPLAKKLKIKLKEFGIESGFNCVFSPEEKIKTDGTLASLVSVTGTFGLVLGQLAINQLLTSGCPTT